MTEAAKRFDAVMLMGYGSPGTPEEIGPFLTDVLHGRPPPAEMVAEYRRRYARIGGSPQARTLSSLRAKVERALADAGATLPVFLGMKHYRPSVADALEAAGAERLRRWVAVPLSPYPSPWILAPYRSALEEAAARAGPDVTFTLAADWHQDPDWIGYWARAIPAALTESAEPKRYVHLSAHSLPKRLADAGDPYPTLLRETAEAIARTARLERWGFTYQSPGNTTEPWLLPDLADEMLRAKERGFRVQYVASFGFVFDHLETLWDLDVVARELAEANGIEYHRVPNPNDDDAVVRALVRTVRTAAARGG